MERIQELELRIFLSKEGLTRDLSEDEKKEYIELLKKEKIEGIP